jgi:hypothetical protein
MSNETWSYLSQLTRPFRGVEGWMCLIAMKEGAAPKPLWFSPHTLIKPLVEFAQDWNRRKWNIYASWAIFREKTRSKATMISSAAFVADFDGGAVKKLDVEPTLIVETSAGHFQQIYVHEPFSVGEAIVAYKNMRIKVGCDPVSADPVHLWRVAGLVNWPDTKKIARGRVEQKANVSGGSKKVVSLGEYRETGRVVEHVSEWPRSRRGRALTAVVRADLKRIVGKNDGLDRSKLFHKFVRAIAELGWGLDEIMEFVRAAPASEKYAGRLEAEVVRCLEGMNAPSGAERFAESVVTFNPSDEGRPIEWLWLPYIPRNEVTILDGDTGAGKTTLMLKVSMDVIVGRKMPNGQYIKGGGRVLYMSVESDYLGTTLDILKAMGLSKPGSFYHHDNPTYQLNEEGIAEMDKYVFDNKIDLVVIDNLINYLPRDERGGETINSYSASTSLIGQLQEVARRSHCAIVAIRHTGKSSRDKLSHRGMGSVGILAGARSALGVIEHPKEKETYVLYQTKCQHAEKGKPIDYSIVGRMGRGVIEWGEESELTEAELNAPAGGEKGPGKLEVACEWLKDYLSREEREGGVVLQAALANEIKRPTLMRAADILGVEKISSGGGRVGRITIWRLPKTENK